MARLINDHDEDGTRISYEHLGSGRASVSPCSTCPKSANAEFRQGADEGWRNGLR
jgi:hypothetical protein